MDRRALLKSAGLAAAAGLAACSPAAPQEGSSPAAPAVQTRQKRELRMVTTWPKNYPGLGVMAERTAEMVGKLTDGALTVRVFGAGEVVGAFEAFDAVSTGAADMYHGAEYYWQGKSPGFSFFTAVPMGLTETEMLGWLKFGGGQALWETLSAQFNIIAFPAGSTGHQTGGWYKCEINSLEDFRGLTVRMPGLGGEVMRGLGAAAVALPGAEIYQALQSGAIDATEWVGPWNDLAFGFHREAKFFYGPGFHEPGSILATGVNRGVWDSLTAADQAAVRAACDYALAQSMGEYQFYNAQALDTLVTEHGVQLRQFSDAIWREVARVSEEVVADIGGRDPETKAIYDSYRGARARALVWSGLGDGPYLRARALSEQA
ncbi:MAG: TRAP transporter substrate-binding protein [Maricaulaceae bacterium]